ncbi:ArsR/SmtB family transcription factor [Opitutus terrae]|uniref:Transcriptional regulator, ArsR family n=1 Tax=Opitutus terrae (strain DSM 11246 / JCM 15787 / PB90-1) TaxID=452637 RepID=B1ZRA6_OPITP|nr:winged helix-turn-helix domain-containing protein [Opitutus terrae]ACB74593.1 transcriptional regulator, ArsR family [Opitutus terrae PB90-1]
MNAEPDLGRLARTIGEPTRLRMLALLMEGRALTAKELAYGAGVTPATGTTHLRLLLAEALVQVRAQGRHKYFRLASPLVARCIESLMVLAPSPTSVDRARAPAQWARLCYDHLAGWLGTEVTRALLERKLLAADRDNFVVTRRGARWFETFGLDLDALRNSRRRFAYACLDWSERREHLGGALGAALAQRMLDSGWLQRRAGTRVLAITAAGCEALLTHFGLQPPETTTSPVSARERAWRQSAA